MIQRFDLDPENPEMERAYNLIEGTKTNVFLTGKAGCGKTTFLKWFLDHTSKRCLVVAPTGIAAVNVGGQTIHSTFGLDVGLHVPSRYPDGTYQISHYNPSKYISRYATKKLLESVELLIIDEISMVRADLLDAISDSLAHFKRSSDPFGKTQILMVGDLFQLPPILTSEEEAFYKMYYDTEFFFSSLALKSTGFESIQLSKVYRQSDQTFIEILNNLRVGMISPQDLQTLNSRFIPRQWGEIFSPSETTLCSTKAEAQRCNDQGMSSVQGESRTFNAVVDGKFPDSKFPVEKNLTLKVGARVMILDNNWQQGYQNGSCGVITEMSGSSVKVFLEDTRVDVIVELKTWANLEYKVVNKNIEREVVGTYTQIPVKPAYSITIHKSQGLTFSQITIDPGRVFAGGQLYVALSRARSLQGIRLLSRIESKHVIVNQAVLDFYLRVFGVKGTVDGNF